MAGVTEIISGPFIKLEYGNGRIVHSLSRFDLGLNPLLEPPIEINVFRKKLGDMAFLTCKGKVGNLINLFFAPEYPNDNYDGLDDVMSFYGVLLSEAVDQPLYEIKLTDPDYQFIGWERGVAMLRSINKEKFCGLQREIADCVVAIDNESKRQIPNLDREEMRRRVGRPIGARLSIMPLALGLV